MIVEKVDPVFFPEPILIRLGVFEGEVAHENIHQGRARKKVGRFRRNNGDLMTAELPDIPRCGYACHTVANDDDLFHVPEIAISMTSFRNQVKKKTSATPNRDQFGVAEVFLVR
jgi:hypothetical protein